MSPRATSRESNSYRASEKALDNRPHPWFHSTAQARRITRVTPAVGGVST
jgi:hypothetical protein